MNYLILEAKDADDLSKELWKLARPNPNPKDVTTHLFGTVTHPVDGRVALQIDLAHQLSLGDTIRPNNLAKLNGLLNKIAPGASSRLANETKDKGKRAAVKIQNILPEITYLTREEMEADGWFAINEENVTQ